MTHPSRPPRLDYSNLAKSTNHEAPLYAVFSIHPSPHPSSVQMPSSAPRYKYTRLNNKVSTGTGSELEIFRSGGRIETQHHDLSSLTTAQWSLISSDEHKLFCI
jgi:hypothetical protein